MRNEITPASTENLMPNQRHSKYVKEEQTNRNNPKNQLDLNIFYDDNHKNYNKNDKTEYYSFVADKIEESIAEKYGISSDSEDYLSEMESIYSEIVSNNDITLNGKKLDKNSTVEEISEALARYSWDGIGRNDIISLPENTQNTPQYELDLNEYYLERTQYTKNKAPDDSYYEKAGNAILQTIADSYGVNIKDKNGNYTNEIKQIYQAIAENNSTVLGNSTYDFNNSSDIEKLNRVLAKISWDGNGRNDIVKLPNIKTITQTTTTEKAEKVEKVEKTEAPETVTKTTATQQKADTGYETLKNELEKQGLSRENFDFMLEGFNSEQLKNEGNGIVNVLDEKTHTIYRINMSTKEFVGKHEVSTGHTTEKDVNKINKTGTTIHSTPAGWLKVGQSYNSSKKWKHGIRLMGLESCNSNTLQRGVVGHYASYAPTGRTFGCLGFQEDFSTIRNEILTEGDLVFVIKDGTNYREVSEIYTT